MRSLSIRSRAARAAVLVVLAFAVATPVRTLSGSSAQQADSSEAVPLFGRVLRDGAPVSQSRVTLHRVTPQASGEVTSLVTDETGEFRFLLEPADGSDFTVYFATAEYLSVRYFGRPIHPTEAGEEYVVEVYDTVYILPEPVRVARRDMVLIPEVSGSWEVNDLIQVYNPSRAALVGASGMPSWEFRIPAGATDFEAGDQADILPHEITLMGDRVMLLTPVIPGSRTLLIRYRLPRGPAEAQLPIGEPTDTFNLFVRLPSHLTSVTGLDARQLFDLDDERFLQYGALGLAPGTPIQLRWAGPSVPPIDPVHAAVGITLLLLGIAVLVAVRNRHSAA